MPFVKSLARWPSGHSGKLPLGRRVVIPGQNPTRALAAAAGFVSTARDLTRFFAGLDPAARRSVLSVASRREMTRPQWRDAHSSVDMRYGLGLMMSRQRRAGNGSAMAAPSRASSAAPPCCPSPGSRCPWSPTPSTARPASGSPASRRSCAASPGRVRRRDASPIGADAGGASGARSISSPWATSCSSQTPLWPIPSRMPARFPLTGRDRGRVSLSSGFGSQGEEVRLDPRRARQARQAPARRRRRRARGQARRRYGEALRQAALSGYSHPSSFPLSRLAYTPLRRVSFYSPRPRRGRGSG